MTNITIPRAVVEQALEALENAEDQLAKPYSTDASKAITALRTALAQQAEPVDTDCHTQGICQRSGYGIEKQAEPVEPVAWVHTDAHNPKVRFLEWTQQAKGYRGDWIKTPLCNCAQPRQSDPQIADRLARHGINPCPDCRGLGYDASGQLCWCQQNPSF